MGYYEVEIVQTIKIKKQIRAANDNDVLRKANKIIEDGTIPIESYDLVTAQISAAKTAGTVINLEQYKQ
ncbi:hypothetical protein [Clostridium aminobutyricum]|uniref:Uncharacterized protein n=1 Tax=Clostridium aminobutyricum TaxID=33953 RepID=A0A939IJU5_CLOAM|nr:hypothetical protein [Clostridium aminobutyricum]MBN7774461.1 hypothetical protein [Clostridium aminobutyricum]